MGLAIYIPWRLFGPLPEWMVPWVVAGCIFAFVYVAVWAIAQRMERPADLTLDGQTMQRGGKATRASLVLVAVLAVVVFLLWYLDPFGAN